MKNKQTRYSSRRRCEELKFRSALFLLICKLLVVLIDFVSSHLDQS